MPLANTNHWAVQNVIQALYEREIL